MLAHNLLSVGQLASSGYLVEFEGDSCTIKDRHTGCQLVNIQKTKNNTFPLEIGRVGNIYVAVNACENYLLWYEHYGHLNLKDMKLLNQRRMVHGLPEIKCWDLCEACVYSKQSRESFPRGRAWRATTKLGLSPKDMLKCQG